jgi:hypothetical protein
MSYRSARCKSACERLAEVRHNMTLALITKCQNLSLLLHGSCVNEMKRAAPEGDAPLQALDVLPTLGEVAMEERFASLRALLQQVAETPVDLLSAGVRGELLEGENKETRVGLFATCDAVRSAEERKRARVGEGDKAGEG